MSSELQPLPSEATELIGTIQKHYKGNRYKVIAIARHSETLEPLVVYQDMNDEQKIWVRPLEMFLEIIEFQGTAVPRFQNIQEL